MSPRLVCAFLAHIHSQLGELNEALATGTRAASYEPGGRSRSSSGTRLPSQWMILSIVAILQFLLRMCVLRGQPRRSYRRAMVPALIRDG